MRVSLNGRVALVTGSSRGIGRGIALKLAENGASVVINFKQNETAANEVVSQIESLGRKSIAVRANLTKETEAVHLIKAIEQEFGRLDILINNVGNFVVKSLGDTSSQDWHNMLDSNLHSVFHVCKNALPGMRNRTYGRIVNIVMAGVSQVRGYEQIPAHAVAKTAALVLTKSLAKEEAPKGITINSVSPGLINTGSLTNETIEKMKRKVPVGRLGTPDDVANAVLFLVSDSASYITGADIVVSGGWSI